MESDRLTRLLLWVGATGAVFFVLVFLVAGARRPGYEASRHPISSLSLGPGGWVQIANFVGFGVAMLALALGAHRALDARGWPSRAGPLLLGAFGLGMVGAGVFVTDPGGGYPPGVIPPLHPSLHSTLHDLCSLVVFTTLPAACLVLARSFARHSEPGWALYAAATGSVITAGFVLLFLGFSGTQGLADVAGLIQRGVVVIGWTWLVLVAIHFAVPSRASSPPVRPDHAARARTSRT